LDARSTPAHSSTPECRARDDEECPRNSALIQQRDIDSELVDARIIEGERDAGVLAILPLRDLGARASAARIGARNISPMVSSLA
jgi:hypothetical protein